MTYQGEIIEVKKQIAGRYPCALVAPSKDPTSEGKFGVVYNEGSLLSPFLNQLWRGCDRILYFYSIAEIKDAIESGDCPTGLLKSLIRLVRYLEGSKFPVY